MKKARDKTSAAIFQVAAYAGFAAAWDALEMLAEVLNEETA
jgi:alkylhydroperoxidase/carboxymuconolactone decarboxylase family protein YurZ